MLIEATSRPIRYRLTDGAVIRLEPGKPVNLPEDRARKLLAKAPGKVRAVEPDWIPTRPTSEDLRPLALRCNGCGQAVAWLHNLGQGRWRCLDCIERREPA